MRLIASILIAWLCAVPALACRDFELIDRAMQIIGATLWAIDYAQSTQVFPYTYDRPLKAPHGQLVGEANPFVAGHPERALDWIRFMEHWRYGVLPCLPVADRSIHAASIAVHAAIVANNDTIIRRAGLRRVTVAIGWSAAW